MVAMSNTVSDSAAPGHDAGSGSREPSLEARVEPAQPQHKKSKKKGENKKGKKAQLRDSLDNEKPLLEASPNSEAVQFTNEASNKKAGKSRAKKDKEAAAANEEKSAEEGEQSNSKPAESESSSPDKPKAGLSRAFSLVVRFAWKSIRSGWLACIVCFLMNLALMIVEATLAQQVGNIIAVPFMSCLFTVIVLIMEVVRRQRKFQALISRRGIYISLFSAFKYVIVIIYLGLCIGYIVTMITGTIRNPLILSESDVRSLNLSYTDRLSVIIMAVIAMLCNIAVLVHVWEISKKGKVQILIVLLCIANFIISVTEIKISSNANNNMVWNSVGEENALPTLYIYTEAFTLCGSLIGLSVGAIVNEKNRLSETIGQFLFLHDGFQFVLCILTLVTAIDSVVQKDIGGYSIPTALKVFYFYTFATCPVLISCSRYLRARRPPSFEVEKLDLSRLTDAQKSAYAKLITYNKSANPGISGESVIEMMETYSQTPLDNMHCTVLRVYKSEKIKQKESREAEAGNSYDTWDVIDRETTIFDEEATLHEEPILEAPKPMSKNQRKRLAKKAAMEGTSYPLELPTEQDIREQAKFHEDLMATEALVLLTTIESYDITATLTGRFGRFIQKRFGKESKSKFLCFRVGLLGFHWPFIRSTFYCQSSDKPVARSAAVMHAIGKWNKAMSSTERCSVMIDPTITNTPAEQAIRLGGWYNVTLPASHIINLKPYKGKSPTEYFKAVKYRNQDGEFKRSRGEVIEVREADDKDCARIIELWDKIADGRSEGGYTATLAAPSQDFIKSMMTSHNKSGDRSLLFLKVNGEIIASCVLFRIGDTITSDIQGLDHELARPMKGYFVMMQETIAIALKEGKNYVDFGPTTEKAKLSIGCKSVPLTGALFTNFPLLSSIVSIAAAHVKV